MKFYLDLDRTAFQTDRTSEIWRKCEELFPEFTEEVAHKFIEHHVTMPGDAYYYDMSPHLQSVGLDPETVYKELLKTDMADGRLQFPGLPELVNTLRETGDLKVLTFGPDMFQRFKASLCPALDGVEVVTTLEDKTVLLKDAGSDTMLIDDKPVGLGLPPKVQFIQVSLEGKNTPVLGDWPLLTSLLKVKEYIDETVH